MQITKINSANIYAAKAVSMKSRMSNQSALRDFNQLLNRKDVILNASLRPDGKGRFQTTIELAKENPFTYGKDPVTDDEGYAISGSGASVNEAILDMLRTYKNQDVYYCKSGSTPIFKMPNYII